MIEDLFWVFVIVSVVGFGVGMFGLIVIFGYLVSKVVVISFFWNLVIDFVLRYMIVNVICLGFFLIKMIKGIFDVVGMDVMVVGNL